MGIGVIDARHGDLVDVRAEEGAGELARSLLRETVIRAHLAAVNPLQHEHALGHVWPDHLGDDELFVVGDESGDQLGVVRLLAEVELRAQVNLELVGQGGDLEELRSFEAALEQGCGRAEDVQVELDLLDHSRPAHLDDHLAAAREQSAVDLRNRCGGERLRIDRREDALAEILADNGLELRERHRRHLVDELAELVDVDVGQEVGAGREELPELHVCRAELLKRASELARPFARGRPLPDDPDLAQNAEQAAPPSYPPDLERAPRALEPGTHRGIMSVDSAPRR